MMKALKFLARLGENILPPGVLCYTPDVRVQIAQEGKRASFSSRPPTCVLSTVFPAPGIVL
jgi:hypothetical protein